VRKDNKIRKVNMELQLDATITVLLISKISSTLSRAKQHARKPLHTTSQDSVPYVVKKSKSCAPEDGQKFARNMLS
jgi:hypothetical protein